MSEYFTAQSILPSDDRKYPLKENSTINWNRDVLMRYFESVRKIKGDNDSKEGIAFINPIYFLLDPPSLSLDPPFFHLISKIHR